jgi:hypothetical protein
MAESCPRYHLKRFALECYSSQRLAAAGNHFEVQTTYLCIVGSNTSCGSTVAISGKSRSQ